MRSQFGRSQTYEDAQLGIQLHIRTVWVLLSLSFMAAGRQVVYDRQEFIEFAYCDSGETGRYWSLLFATGRYWSLQVVTIVRTGAARGGLDWL